MATAEKEALSGEALAVAAARFADGKLAEDVAVLDVRGLSTVTDYFVVCSGTSMPHLRAVRKEVMDRLKVEAGASTYTSDGGAVSLWLVLDYVDVMVHIFHPEKRDIYKLEELWGDAPRVTWEDEA